MKEQVLLMNPYFYRDGRPVAFPPRSRKKHPPAQAYVDFNIGVDKVIRYDERCFVVDGAGNYAPMEVRYDGLTDAIRANLDALTPIQRGRMVIAILKTAWLSDEGKQERLAYLSQNRPIFEVIEGKD